MVIVHTSGTSKAYIGVTMAVAIMAAGSQQIAAAVGSSN